MMVCSRLAKVGCIGILAVGLAGLQTIAALATAPTPPVTATFQWDDTKQQIVGFGASGSFGQAGHLQALTDKKTQRYLLDQLFSTRDGAGLTVVRNAVGDGSDSPSIEPAPGHWSWLASTGFSDDQIWLMKQAEQYGVHTFISSVWSPPAWMKTSHQVDGGVQDNYLSPGHYQDYANYLAAYVKGYASHFGIPIAAISVQNEPDQNTSYASCLWTPQQIDVFIKKYLNPTFQREQVRAKVMIPETSFWGEMYALPTLNDPAANAGIDIVAAHGYGGAIAPLSAAEARHKQVWQTETMTNGLNDPSIRDGLKWADLVNRYLTVADVSEWNYWWFVRAGSTKQSAPNDALINLTSPKGTYIINKRLYTIGNFSRFVRPGYLRIEGPANPAPGVSMSAYKDPISGRFAVVVINDNTVPEQVDISISGTRIHPDVVPYVTSNRDNLRLGEAIRIRHGSMLTTVAPQSVTTFTGVGEERGHP